MYDFSPLGLVCKSLVILYFDVWYVLVACRPCIPRFFVLLFSVLFVVQKFVFLLSAGIISDASFDVVPSARISCHDKK